MGQRGGSGGITSLRPPPLWAPLGQVDGSPVTLGRDGDGDARPGPEGRRTRTVYHLRQPLAPGSLPARPPVARLRGEETPDGSGARGRRPVSRTAERPLGPRRRPPDTRNGDTPVTARPPTFARPPRPRRPTLRLPLTHCDPGLSSPLSWSLL